MDNLTLAQETVLMRMSHLAYIASAELASSVQMEELAELTKTYKSVEHIIVKKCEIGLEFGFHRDGFLGRQPTPVLTDSPLDLSMCDLEKLPWERRTETRQELFYAHNKLTYEYGRGRGKRTYTSNPVPETLLPTFNFAATLGLNACFLNRYADEGQHLGWHSDDHSGTDHRMPIIVLSVYGENAVERELWWRIKETKGMVPPERRVLMHNNSVLTMPPGFQRLHEHRVPKHVGKCGPRISLTFRAFK